MGFGDLGSCDPRVTSTVDSYRQLLAKTFASQPAVRDLGALKRGSRGLGNLPGVRIRGPGPWAVVRVIKLPF